MARSPRDAVALLSPDDQVKLDRAMETGDVATGIDFTKLMNYSVTSDTLVPDSHKERALHVARREGARVVATGYAMIGGIGEIVLARKRADWYQLYFNGRRRMVYVVDFDAEER